MCQTEAITILGHINSLANMPKHTAAPVDCIISQCSMIVNVWPLIHHFPDLSPGDFSTNFLNFLTYWFLNIEVAKCLGWPSRWPTIVAVVADTYIAKFCCNGIFQSHINDLFNLQQDPSVYTFLYYTSYLLLELNHTFNPFGAQHPSLCVLICIVLTHRLLTCILPLLEYWLIYCNRFNPVQRA